MEKSIEERANKFALEKHPYSPFYEEYTKMYIEIATEQQAIDIDKTCEWAKQQNFSLSVQLDLQKFLEG